MTLRLSLAQLVAAGSLIAMCLGAGIAAGRLLQEMDDLRTRITDLEHESDFLHGDQGLLPHQRPLKP